MHNYHTANGVFPMGSSIAPQINSPGLQNSIWSAWSAQALMLGYLEQAPLYNACNFSWAVLDASNFSGQASVAPVLQLQPDRPVHQHLQLHVPVGPQRGPGPKQQQLRGILRSDHHGLYNWTTFSPGNYSASGEPPPTPPAFSRSPRATVSRISPMALPIPSLTPKPWWAMPTAASSQEISPIPAATGVTTSRAL